MKVFELKNLKLIKEINYWWNKGLFNELMDSLTKEEESIVNLHYSSVVECKEEYKEECITLNIYTDSPLCGDFPLFVNKYNGLIDIISLRFLESFGVDVDLNIDINELLNRIKKSKLDYHEMVICINEYNYKKKLREDILLYCDNINKANGELIKEFNRHLNNYELIKNDKNIQKQLKK